MITIDTINDIYNKYTSLPVDADVCTQRNLHNLMMYTFDSDHMDFEGDRITLTQGAGPLKAIAIDRICGAEDLGSHWAIVLPASVIFVNKKSGEIRVFLAE